jgi:hypothetical protein
VSAVRERVDPVCEDGELLDCIAVNLCVLLRHRGAADWRSPFACQWRFAFADAEGGLPALEHEPLASVIAEQSGLRLRDVEVETGALAGLVERAGPVLLRGDAFAMRWVPYHGHAHMEHSFIVDGVSPDGGWAEAADGYANRTEWGDAVPCRFRLGIAELGDLCAPDGVLRAQVFERAGPPRAVDAPAWLRRNAAAMAGAGAALAAFADRARLDGGDLPERFERFVLACWLVHRARALHARWLGTLERDALPPGFAAEFEESVVGAWRRAAEFAYVASRRVRLGRALPPAPFDIVADQAAPAELDLAGSLSGWLEGER